MKIKGKLLIPLFAIIIALFTVGITPGSAADTTVSVSDELTYVYETVSTTNLEEEVEDMVSGILGDKLEGAEAPLRGISEMMADMLSNLKGTLNKIIDALKNAGGALGGDSSVLEDLFGDIGDIEITIEIPLGKKN